eukprot:Tamp_05121.p1 GENE.Tamp_05121~~Tamp_05121.p1  ORF type:complete len:565 (+),score=137.31 Tamp_05121:187-1695(+)
MQLEPNGKAAVQDKASEEGTQLIDLGKASSKRFEGELARKKLVEADMELRPVADDVLRPSLYVGGFAAAMAALTSVDFVPASLPLVLTFMAGYAAIVFEEVVGVQKTAVALAMGIACWTMVPHAAGLEMPQVLEEMGKAINDTSQIVFFLIGAMAIVETVDAHKGFSFVTDRINTTDKRALVVLVGFLSFFLSAILDNLTTTIVVCSLLGKLVPESEKETRQLLGGLTVIAANAGGAWSPIGDVTTTMLWMGGQITSVPLVTNVFLPSLACVMGAMGWQLLTIDGAQQLAPAPPSTGLPPRGSSLVTAVGLGGLLFVPVFKSVTGLPPFGGMLLSMASLWALTDRLHGEDRPKLRMTEALRRTDVADALFFLGVLLAVAALETSGTLTQLAQLLSELVPNDTLVAAAIGAVSAVVDNVPLVAAAMGMYDMTTYPADAQFWDLIAFCAGTGGSMLIIGSAAGIAYMGIEEVSFGWYLKRIAPGAVIGYLAGIATLVAQGTGGA